MRASNRSRMSPSAITALIEERVRERLRKLRRERSQRTKRGDCRFGIAKRCALEELRAARVAGVEKKQARTHEVARTFGDVRGHAADGFARCRRADRLQDAERRIVQRRDAIDDKIVDVAVELFEESSGQPARNVVAEECKRSDVGTSRLQDCCFGERQLTAIEKCIEIL